MGSSYLKYYRASKALAERPVVEVAEEQRDQQDGASDGEQTVPLYQTPRVSVKTKLLIGGVVFVAIVGVFMYFKMRKGGTEKTRDDKNTDKNVDKEVNKNSGISNGYVKRQPDPGVFYSPDTLPYSCSGEGTKVSVYDCRKDINCMWLYNGHDVNSGICTHRVLRPAPSKGCKSFKTAHECNMRNDRYIWKHGKCMTRPL